MIELTEREKQIIQKNKHYLENNDLEGFLYSIRDEEGLLRTAPEFYNIRKFLYNKINNMVTYFKDIIPEDAFAGLPIKKIVIPNGINIIDAGAFDRCKELEDIIFPTSLRDIYTRAFFHCEALEELNFPEGLRYIDNNAFNGCSNLKQVTIPDTVTNIGWNAFKGCTSLTSIELPASVKEIGFRPFAECINLREIICHFEPEDIEWERWREYKDIIRVV